MEEGKEGVPGYKTVTVKREGQKPIEVQVPETQEENVWDYRKRMRKERLREAREETLARPTSLRAEPGSPAEAMLKAREEEAEVVEPATTVAPKPPVKHPGVVKRAVSFITGLFK